MKRILLGVLLGSLVSPLGPSAGEEMLRVEQAGTDGNVVVRSRGPSPDGQFKLVFSRRAGGISSWYDLDRDPEEHHNLAGHGGLPQDALLMHMLRPAGAGYRDILYSAPAEKIEVLEENAVRVRLRLEGVYGAAEEAERFPSGGRLRGIRNSHTGAEPDIRFVTTYTIYATGQLYVSHSLHRLAGTLTVGQSVWALGTAPSSRFRAVGSVADAQPGSRSRFVLHTSRGPAYFADALLVPHVGPLTIIHWGGRFLVGPEQMGATRSSFELHAPETSIGAQGSRWCGLLQLEPDWMDRAALAAVAAETYQTPPAVNTEPGWGEVSRGEPGDRNVDGFVEEEGCYVVRAARGRCRIRFDLSDSLLTSPVFKVTDWSGRLPATVALNGQELASGSHFQVARLAGFTILVQVYRSLSGGPVELELQTRVPRRR